MVAASLGNDAVGLAMAPGREWLLLAVFRASTWRLGGFAPWR